MTEEQIERVVEREIDKLDTRLMRGLISQKEYDRDACRIDRWASQQYRAMKVDYDNSGWNPSY